MADASTSMRGKDVVEEDLAAANPTAVDTAVHMAAEDDSTGSEGIPGTASQLASVHKSSGTIEIRVVRTSAGTGSAPAPLPCQVCSESFFSVFFLVHYNCIPVLGTMPTGTRIVVPPHTGIQYGWGAYMC